MGSPQPTCHSYQRRQPELTPCYRIVQTEFETFRQKRELEGRPLPQYITDEFEAYLKCGILAHAFLRLLCPDCNHEKITAFSCKKRGFVGADVLALGKGRVLVSSSAPETIALLKSEGLQAYEVEASEIHKADGALTCPSVRIPREGHGCT